ncbi:MAG: hypothetical protein HQK49_14070 [Oligoflexia bacterium]|nr:hypothetical protein [Oligoflexia bacterium]
MEESLLELKSNIITYSGLLDLYKDKKNPKDKVYHILKNGELIKIRRNLYVLGDRYKRGYSLASLANLVYGPSAISLEWALSHHGLIPERVNLITSVCFKRKKMFQTPVGVFAYSCLPVDIYSVGIEYHQQAEGNFLMASAEKALIDLIFLKKIKNLKSQSDHLGYLLDDLRIDEDALKKFNKKTLLQIKKVHSKEYVINFINTLISFSKR